MTLARATTALFVLPALSAVAVPDVEISHGVKMPMIAFGTARVSLSSCSVFDGVHQWLQLGGRHIDTAHDYGTEPDVGEALKKSDATCDLHCVKREDIFITTKIPGPIGGAAVQKMVLNETLPNLGVDYVDLLLIHFPCLDMKDFPNACGSKLRKERLDTWHGITELRKQGKVRAIGATCLNGSSAAPQNYACRIMSVDEACFVMLGESESWAGTRDAARRYGKCCIFSKHLSMTTCEVSNYLAEQVKEATEPHSKTSLFFTRKACVFFSSETVRLCCSIDASLQAWLCVFWRRIALQEIRSKIEVIDEFKESPAVNQASWTGGFARDKRRLLGSFLKGTPNSFRTGQKPEQQCRVDF
eukprot:Skav203685  [mRNA]  locus=scaffold259:132859:136099:+ [translate_table: standard]